MAPLQTIIINNSLTQNARRLLEVLETHFDPIPAFNLSKIPNMISGIPPDQGTLEGSGVYPQSPLQFLLWVPLPNNGFNQEKEQVLGFVCRGLGGSEIQGFRVQGLGLKGWGLGFGV